MNIEHFDQAADLLDLLQQRRYEAASAMADRLASERFEITRSWSNLPYMVRWTLLGKRFDDGQAVFLHRFQRSDADEPHDHPWSFTSIILAGGYWEVTPADGWSNGAGPTQRQWHGLGSVLRRPATWIHSVQIPDGEEAWTLVMHGAKERTWGFWCPNVGWRPWREHLAAAEASGNGCG